ncbi:LacI family DNA-binding transcriptional regulator [Breznakiella homolactica]|uniref:LacI family DNA-binding transcriptional regulator n=1 Tax=Breznakiella homolactica TaxID=2798577 RepID=A0A7T7XN30_9SPIR|nr:LacI family DNA-binding transcriptional regulator [Breznakiella homolactica]QQO09389.1 LacI family transcriptional regulator [Breznakiella homolactica]
MTKNPAYRKPTMKDVAQTAGVSISSVSHVLNGTRFVSEDTKKKVEQAIQELNFKPNPIARNLRSGKSKLIGFVVSNLENYFYVSLAKGIEKTIGTYGYRLMLIDSAESKKREIENAESLYLRGVDGLIIVPATPDCEYLKKIVRPGYPVVFVDRQPSNYSGDTVLLANAEAAFAATNYFISKGYRDIGFLGFHFGDQEIDKTMQERIDGYTQALREAGIPVNRDFIQVKTGMPAAMNELQHTESYKMMEHLRKSAVRAVLCGNSLSAIGAYSYLKENQIRIPDDISLITFDDDVWLKLTTPRISSVVQPAESLGILAAQRLMNRLGGKDLPYECFRLKADIVLRES